MTGARRTRIEPDPTPEEAAAIEAALEMLREREPEDRDSLNRSRWRLAGLLGHPVPARMKLEGALWSYSSWEGMT
jgi:predicted DNA-binding transcriptional regulator YafY